MDEQPQRPADRQQRYRQALSAGIEGARHANDGRERDMLLRSGLIWAVLFPLIGLIYAVRLFARDRVGPGLAVLLTSGVVIVLYVAATSS